MNKIYIPTTTLNFNNILSTESISPKSFYFNRRYGYKRFETIEANKYDSILVAYSKIPIFNIEDSERDNYPLILELSRELIEDNIKVIDKVGDIEIYQISKTIYFHPNKVKFLFLNDENKKITLIKSQPSIETKLLSLYQNDIVIYTKENNFKWEEKYLKKINQQFVSIDENTFNDRLLNKIKGFYFCYTFGEIYKESSKQFSIKQKLLKKIDIVKEAINKEDLIYKELIKELCEFTEKGTKIIIYMDINLNGLKLGCRKTTLYSI